MKGDYDDDKSHIIRNTLSQLGVADVKAFGLEWKDCEAIMERLGFKLGSKSFGSSLAIIHQSIL